MKSDPTDHKNLLHSKLIFGVLGERTGLGRDPGHHHSTHKEVDHTVELRRLPQTWLLTVDLAPSLVQVVQTSIFFAEHGQLCNTVL